MNKNELIEELKFYLGFKDGQNITVTSDLLDLLEHIKIYLEEN